MRQCKWGVAAVAGRHQVRSVANWIIFRVYVPHKHGDSLVSGQRQADFHRNTRIRNIRRSPVSDAMRSDMGNTGAAQDALPPLVVSILGQ